ncbi:MAG: hypothetical protein GXY60_12555 [Spirochaetales bacterium]|nr:hypothetical protein [Spirochaetales bacterium]
MKKFLSLAMMLVLVLSLTFSALAAEPTLDARVEKGTGNTNSLYITVNGTEYGPITINNNADGVYEVGGYKVFVATQGNVKTDIYVVYDGPSDPTIVGERTVTTTTFDGYATSFDFLANQKYQKGPSANYLTAKITETYTVNVKVYDVYSDGAETLREESSSTSTISIEGKSNAMPNGAKNNYVPTFSGGLEGYAVSVTYIGNGNKYSVNVTSAPAHDPVVVDTGVVYF